LHEPCRNLALTLQLKKPADRQGFSLSKKIQLVLGFGCKNEEKTRQYSQKEADSQGADELKRHRRSCVFVFVFNPIMHLGMTPACF